MSQDEEILQTFFYVLSRTVELNNLRSVKDFFTISETNKIDKAEMGKGLLKLGYEENSLHYEFLMKKYQNFHVKTLINLNVIVEEYENYLSQMKKEKEKIKPASNITSNVISNVISNMGSPDTKGMNTGFRINNENTRNTNFDMTDKSNFGLGETKYVNTGISNMGTTGAIGTTPNPNQFTNTNSNYNNNDNNFNKTNQNNQNQNIYVQENDEFNFSSGRRRTKPISFRDEEIQPTRNQIEETHTYNTSKESTLMSEPGFQSKSDLSNSSRPPTFGKTNSQKNAQNNQNNLIVEKLEKLNKKMMDELQENLSYIKVTLYEKFHNYYLTQKEEFESDLKRRTKSDKFILQENFEDFLDSCLVLTDDDKKIILMDIIRNNSGKYSSEDFFDKIKNFDKNEIFNQIRNYNLNYNDYIIALRSHFKENQINVKATWIEVFQSVPKADIIGFSNYLGMTGLIYSQEESDYIFRKLSEDSKFIIFKNFECIINRSPPSRESLQISQLDKMTASVNGLTSNNGITGNDGLIGNNGLNTGNTQIQTNNNNKTFPNSNSTTPMTTTGGVKEQFVRRSLRDENLFSEIKNKSAQESMTIIFQRLQINDKKIQDILSQMQNYKTYKLYETLNRILKPMGNFAESYFLQMDMRRQGFLTDTEFSMVLTYLKVELNDEQRDLIFQSLTNKTPTAYSYREFLNRVMFYTGNEIFDLTRKANQFLNDYVIELRDYIRQNKIEINITIEKIVGKINTLTFDQFCKFMTSINFNLSHIQELKYLFGLLSDDNVNLNTISFFDLMMLDTPEINAFIESGNLKNKDKNALSWKSKLINFTDEFAKTYQKNYQHLLNILKDINTKSKKDKTNSDLIYIFENCTVTNNGEIEKNVFINLMHKLGIVKDVSFHTLLQTFSNQKNELFNLVGFLNGYNSFYYKEKQGNDQVKEIVNNNSTVKTATNTSIEKTQIQASPTKTQLSPVIEKNHKQDFTQENLEYLDEVVNYLVDIILEEKKMNVVDFFVRKDTKKVNYFTKADFIKILYEDLEIDTEGEKATLEIFYNYLINDNLEENKKIGFEPIKIEKLISVFKKFAAEGIELKKVKPGNTTAGNMNQNTNNKTSMVKSTIAVSREEKIIEEFSHYINNNRIKFTNVFPILQTNPNEATIQVFDLKSAFSYSGYPIAHDDVELLLKYFDPFNKTRVSLDLIRSKIKLYDPEYFNSPFQKIDQSKINKQTIEFNNNPKIMNIIKIMSNYIQSKNLTIEEFFKQFDKNNDDKISKTEFIQIMVNIDEKVSIDDLVVVFNYIDKNNTSSITLNEFYAYFNSANMTSEQRGNKIKISDRMLDEVSKLFVHFDKDADGRISKDDFFKALKSMNNRTTMDDVNFIMKKVDKNGDNFVDKKEFMEIMQESIRQEIVMKEEEKEYFIRLFKEEDIDKVCYLTPVQMKHLLKEKLQCDLSDVDIEELIDEVDVNRDGMIDIDEFIKLLGLDNKTEGLKHTVRKINLKRKINPMTFLSIFDGLPMNFIPSFIKEEQKLFKLLPSATLRPRTDQTGILYEDILPNVNKTNDKKESLALRPISTKINAKISFGNATGVAIPDENVLKREESILGRILKISLFNASTNTFVGNSISIEATWKKNYEDRWYFEEDKKMYSNNIIIRYNGSDYENIQVILEFIILIKKENIVTETSCGWSSIEMKDLLKSIEIKLQIKGGCPNKKDDISRSDIRTKRSGWAKVAQFFSGEVKSQLPIKSKPSKDFNNQDKSLIDFLPTCIVIQRAALQMCVIYRKFISKHILNNQFYSLKVIKSQHSIINNFCKIVDCPDAFRPMVELWNTIVVEPATSNEKKDENYWEFNLLDFVNRTYTVLYSEKFIYNEIDPTQLSLGDKGLSSIRNLLINSAIKFDKGKRINKYFYIINFITRNTVVEPVENLTTFKPFTIDECIEKKIDIISKLDEILPSKNIFINSILVNERSVCYDLNKSDLDLTR